MRFNCGLSREAKAAISKSRMEEKAKVLKEWHKVFVWLPVRLMTGECVWLEHVERRFTDVSVERCLFGVNTAIPFSSSYTIWIPAYAKEEYRDIDDSTS